MMSFRTGATGGPKRRASARCLHGDAHARAELGGGLNVALLVVVAGPVGCAVQGKMTAKHLASASQWRRPWQRAVGAAGRRDNSA
jgi:hypothetical protein